MARRPVARFVLVFGLLAVIACAALVVLLPRWVKARIIAAAAANGVALTIDDLSLAPGHARLRGVHASPLIRPDAKGGPNASATAQIVDVDLDGLTPKALTVTGMHVDVDGSLSDVRAALVPRDKGAEASSPLERVTVKDASLTWKHALPTDRVVIDAVHVQGNVTRKSGRNLGDDWHFETPELRAFDKKDLPPWSATADADSTGTRASVTLPKKAKLAIAADAKGARTFDVDTPETTVAELGIPPELLGLYGDETSHFEIHLHHHETDADHADGSVVAAASNVYLGPATNRTSFAVDARYAGDPKTALKITTGTLRAGPFTGALSGGFAIDPTFGFKASLHYASGVMSCVDAVKSQAANYGDLGKGVAALAGMLGFDRAVEGRISLKGDIQLDSQQKENRFSFRTEGDCKLSYLPSL